MDEDKPKRKSKALPEGQYIPAKEVKQVRDQYGRLVWVHKQLNPDDLPHRVWEFSETTADQICMLVTEGHTLKEISKIKGMPPMHIIYSWTRNNKKFKEDLHVARQDRAHFYHDHAIDVAMETRRKIDVPVNKFKVETLKWAAEKGNASTYGSKTVHEGNPEAPIQFIIDTGVRRTPIEVQAEQVVQVESKTEDLDV